MAPGAEVLTHWGRRLEQSGERDPRYRGAQGVGGACHAVGGTFLEGCFLKEVPWASEDAQAFV